jgi:flagellar basal-body rod modification protein FlgD
MSAINPTTSTTATHASSQSTTSTDQTMLDKDSFLKLMMVELQHQDPLQPTDPTQYINELSQLTTLEQTTNLAASAAKTAAAQNTATALQLLGHTVNYTDSSGNAQSGTVQRVQFTSTGPTLTIDGIDGIDPSSVDEVS